MNNFYRKIGILSIFVFTFYLQSTAQDYNAKKTIFYTNTLCSLDSSTKKLNTNQTDYILNQIKKDIYSPKFNYTELNESECISDKNTLTIDDVSYLAIKEIIPNIIENLSTGAYLYLPVISNVSVEKIGKDAQDTWEYSAKLGIIWYKISTDNNIRLFFKKTVSVTYTSKYTAINKGVFSIDRETVSGKEFAFRTMVKKALKEFMAVKNQIPEFNISGELSEVSFLKAKFESDKDKNIKTDDKYLIIDLAEEADGTVYKKNIGWMQVTKPENDIEGNIIAGKPQRGMTLKKYPRLPIDIKFGFRNYSYSYNDFYYNQSNPPDTITKGVGAELVLLYDIGKSFEIPQLFFGVSYGKGVGIFAKKNDLNNNSIGNTNIEAVFLEKFYFKRLAIAPELRFGMQSIKTNLKEYKNNNSFGMFMGGDIEYAITPCLNLYTSCGKQFFNKKKWISKDLSDTTRKNEISYNGLNMVIGINWSLPPLPSEF